MAAPVIWMTMGPLPPAAFARWILPDFRVLNRVLRLAAPHAALARPIDFH
jgi:hypothetical protein